jgi:hypothetical protein
MKTYKAIILLAVIVAVLDAAIITVLRVVGSVPVDEYGDLIIKSMSVIGIVAIAALVVGAVAMAMGGKSNS